MAFRDVWGFDNQYISIVPKYQNCVSVKFLGGHFYRDQSSSPILTLSAHKVDSPE